MKWISGLVLCAAIPLAILAQKPVAKPTLGSIRQTYLDQSVVVGGPVTTLGGRPGLLEWNVAHQAGSRYESGVFDHLPDMYRRKTAKVVAVQLNPTGRSLMARERSSAPRTNALGEVISDNDTVDPYFDLVVQFDDGTLALTSAYAGTLSDHVTLASEQRKAEEEMAKGLPLLIGKTLYAAGFSHLYEPDTTLEEMCGSAELLKRLPNVPLLEPLQITVAKFVDPGTIAALKGVVLKLRLPDGREALAFTSHISLDNAGKDEPFIQKVSGSLLVALPRGFTPQEIDAVKHRTIFRGMSKEAVEYALGGLPETQNDWGTGGKQLIFGKRLFVYLDRQDKVVDWQALDGK